MMSTGLERPLVAEMRHGFSAPSAATGTGSYCWASALIAVGCIALSSAVVASLATASAIGILFLLGGIPEMVGTFWCRGWSGFFLHLLAGVLSVVIGLLFLRAPGRCPSRTHAPHGERPVSRGDFQDRDGESASGSVRGAGPWRGRGGGGLSSRPRPNPG